ncbi:Interleukin-2 receptor subunit beta [Chelonia mydas]|uniref:Interleukin-2 receptor subunit beta n=1 Tax=Chelonia mydas TaxID=8469 RepID=M7BM84_CHEMY|nr:Interleukin-2 receptor subunit beta [Chelonia mydas]
MSGSVSWKSGTWIGAPPITPSLSPRSQLCDCFPLKVRAPPVYGRDEAFSSPSALPLAVHPSRCFTGIKNHSGDLRSCEFPSMAPRRCELAFSEDIVEWQVFTIADSLNLTVSCQTGENWTTVMQKQEFKPWDNIQLRPPDNLQVVNTSDSSYNLTWRIPISSHYLKKKREFEVLCKDRTTAMLLSIKQDQEWVRLENLSPDSEYEAAVRVKPNAYGVWSNWSKTLAWRTNHSGYSELPPGDLQLTMPALVGTICTIFVVVIIVLIITSQPLKSMSSISPEISELEIIQKEKQESQLLLPKAFLTSGAPPETSGHSLTSCFTNQGYFFFHLPDSYEIEPCQVYFTYEPFARKSSGSEDGDSYGALPSPDLCMLENDLPLFSSGFLHCIEANQGFQNSSFVGEIQNTTNGLGALPEALLSPESSSPASVLEQDEKVNGNVTVLQLSESQQKPGMVFSGIPGLHDNDAIQTTEKAGDAGPEISSTTTMADASSLFSQPMPPRQSQTDDLHRTASSSQVPNTGAYLSLSELQSQYNHHSV